MLANARACGIPAMTLPPCDGPWGHDGVTHVNQCDGFHARDYDKEHAARQRETLAAGAWMAKRVRLAREASGSPIVEAVERCEPSPSWNDDLHAPSLWTAGGSVGFIDPPPIPPGLYLWATDGRDGVGSAATERDAKIAVQRAHLALVLGGGRP